METVYKSTLLPLLANSTRNRYEESSRTISCRRSDRSAARSHALTLQPYESRDKIRDVMSTILSSAVTYGILVKNPMQGVRLSPGRKGNGVRPYIDPMKFSSLLVLIPEPYATMVHVAAFTGLRPSELVGLRWRNVHEDSITVEERYCRGEWCSQEQS